MSREYPGAGDRTYWCDSCVAQSARIERNEIYARRSVATLELQATIRMSAPRALMRT